MKHIPFDELLSLPQHLHKDETIYNYPVVLYGAGVGGDYTLRYLEHLNVKPVAVCDTYKAGQDFHGYTLCTVSDVLERYEDPRIIITSIRFYEEIKKQLLEHFPEEALISFVSQTTHEKLEEFKEFVKQNQKGLQSLYDRLEDEKSRETLIHILKGRITGDNEWALKAFAPDQYFPKDIIALGSDESFLDGGAYVGDSAEIFMEKVNHQFEKIYCFEPGESNYGELCKMARRHGHDPRILLYKAGLYSRDTQLGFADDSVSPGNAVSEQCDATNTIDVVAIDQTISDKVTFIKFDIEGSELDALHGARQTILKHKPKLAICVYHKNQDFITIPDFIMGLGLDYKYYLRHHSPHDFYETVFYAV